MLPENNQEACENEDDDPPKTDEIKMSYEPGH